MPKLLFNELLINAAICGTELRADFKKKNSTVLGCSPQEERFRVLNPCCSEQSAFANVLMVVLFNFVPERLRT